MEIWTPDMKLEKKNCQIMLKENIQGQKSISRLVTIEDGIITQKPDDVQLLGKLTSEGFVVSGLRIIKDEDNKEKCIICGIEYESWQVFVSDKDPWKKLCEDCWNLPFDEKQHAIEEYRKRIFK